MDAAKFEKRKPQTPSHSVSRPDHFSQIRAATNTPKYSGGVHTEHTVV